MLPKLDFLAQGLELSKNHSSFLNLYAYNVANQPVWNLGTLNSLFDRVHNGLIWCVLGTGSSQDVEIPQLGYRLFETTEFYGIKGDKYTQGITVPLRIFSEYLLLVLDESGYPMSRMKYETSERSNWRTQALFLLDEFKPQEAMELTRKLRESLPESMLKSHTVVNN